MHRGPIRLRPLFAGQIRGRRIKPVLEPDIVIQLRRQRPSQAGAARAQTPAPEISELRAELRAARRRDTITLGVAYLGGGLFWLALSRGREWPGWVLLAAGVGIVAYGLRRKA